MKYLSGDPEIDQFAPKFPLIIRELLWFSMDRSRYLVAGSQYGSVVPRKLGNLDLLEFVNKLDGSVPLHDLVYDAQGEVMEDQRNALLMLFSNGLIEDGPATDQIREVCVDQTLAFLARIMDQTRVANSRKQITDFLAKKVALSDVPASVVNLLKFLGLDCIDSTSADERELTVVFLCRGFDYGRLEQLILQCRPTLLMSVRDGVLRIGPLLLGRGTCTVSQCEEIHAGAEEREAWNTQWDLVIANTVMLLHTRTAPFSLINKYLEFRFDHEAASSALVDVSRRTDEMGPAEFGQENAARIQRQTRLSGLPSRYAGHKAYEAHYSAQYLSAAQQIPDSPVIAETQNSAQEPLLQALDIAFGYEVRVGASARRNCPTGGNLGSPECLVVHFDHAAGLKVLYRFIPMPARLERLGAETMVDLNLDRNRNAYLVVALGNAAKLAFKYKLLGDNVVQLDAGLAAAFFNAATAAAGITPSNWSFSLEESIVATWLARRKDAYVPTWTVEIAGAKKRSILSFTSANRYRQFRGLIRRRSAIRLFEATGLEPGTILDMIGATSPRIKSEWDARLIACINLITFIKEDETSSTYLSRDEDGRFTSRPLHDVHDFGDLVCQRTLSQAPVKIFFFVDLFAVLAQFGPEGHDAILKLIGMWVGNLWLDLEARGLSGCPAGATAECDILSQLPAAEADRWFGMFCFNFGRVIR